MLGEYKEILNEVARLASIRRIKEEREGKTSFHVGDGIDEKLERILSGEKSELESFLVAQDFESVKVVQTVMYVGRNVSNDELQNNPNLSPEIIYVNERKGLDELGWNKKEIEVHQICEKGQLDRYIKRGMEILKVID